MRIFFYKKKSGSKHRLISFFDEYDLFGSVRILTQNDGKVLFCGADVAKALGYSNAPDAISKHCKKDGIAKCDSVDSIGRKNILSFITEGNLYRLITHSKLPDAEKFEKWVFND